MPLSVSNSQSGMPNLLRQTRPAKSVGDGSPAGLAEASGTAVRPAGRATIDSTGARTARINATLTLVMSRLGQGSEPGPDRARATAQPPAALRSGASDVLRMLDAYAADPLRLSA